MSPFSRSPLGKLAGKVAQAVNKRPTDMLPEDITGTSEYEKLMLDARILQEVSETPPDFGQMSTLDKIKWKRRNWPKKYR